MSPTSRRRAALLALALAACRADRAADPHAEHAPPAAPAAPTADPHAGHAGHAAPADPHAGHAGHAAPAAPAVDHAAHGGLPAGHAEVTIAPDRQQAIGLRLATATHTSLAGAVRASATVAADERREAHVHSRVMGYVRDLHVATIGQRVRRGQPLYSIYSQDVIVAQQEYLRARGLSADLAAAARERLRRWEVPEDQLRALDTAGTPFDEITVRSPIAGTVIEKTIVRGHFVEPEMMLYRIADLARVWVIADVYEYELGRIDRAAAATIRVEGAAAPLTAPIDYVYPTVDPVTRTVKVRLVVDNKGGELRPGSFATVELPVRGGSVLTIPDEAVLDTGTHRLVYVAVGADGFRPVEVEVGARAGGQVEIRRGLVHGDRVVSSAQFLVDSESRLRAGGGGGGHGGH